MERLLTIRDFINYVTENVAIFLMGFALAVVEVVKYAAKIVEFIAITAIAVFMYFIMMDVHTLVALQQHKAKATIQSSTKIQTPPKDLKLYIPSK